MANETARQCRQAKESLLWKRVGCGKKKTFKFPEFASPGAAGMDISAAIPEHMEINPGKFRIIPAGFAMALPSGYEAQIRSRSGLAKKFGLVVLGGVGTIDADYRGEVNVLLMNYGPSRVNISPGDRIAQMIISRVYRPLVLEVDTLSTTSRGDGGFGSTGR